VIVLDASVLIAHFDSTDAHHQRADALLLKLEAEPLAASPLTLAEVLVGPARSGHLAQAVVALSQLEVSTVPLDEGAPVKLATLRARTNLKLPDCCVLLAAEQVHATLATFDEQLAAAAIETGFAVTEQ
jgi:predicted nucleic acid-binding protein